MSHVITMSRTKMESTQSRSIAAAEDAHDDASPESRAHTNAASASLGSVDSCTATWSIAVSATGFPEKWVAAGVDPSGP